MRRVAPSGRFDVVPVQRPDGMVAALDMVDADRLPDARDGKDARLREEWPARQNPFAG